VSSMDYRRSDHNDCEDQGMARTSTCVKFACQTWNGDVRIQPSLIMRGRYWCCPRCGSSYGSDAR